MYNLALIAFPGKTKEKTPVLSLVFGFLASLAITYGLLKYYDNFITPVVIPQASSIESLLPLLSPTSLNILPTLHLIVFFIVAIPLTHSGYIFLSSLVIRKIDTENLPNWKKGIADKYPAFCHLNFHCCCFCLIPPPFVVLASISRFSSRQYISNHLVTATTIGTAACF